MASLTGNTIQSTYDSLLKVTDNDSITGSLKRITDGLGNNTPLYLSSSAVEIVSTLNVTSTITASNLSGTNTGDETKSSIETKLGAATSSNSGYLTSTDWSTFNNKIAGTGTLNKLAKFSSSSSIADSTITDTGSAVTIGVATSVTGSLTASSLIRTGGTSSQFLKADGSVDSTTYTPTSRTLTINGTTYDLSSNRTWTINPSQWSTNPSGPGIEYGDTVSIGGLASYTEPAKLFVAATNPDYGVIAKFKNSFSSTPLTGTKIAFETNGVGEWRMGLDGGTDYFVINRYDSGSFTESFAIAGNGKVIIPNNVGIGITNPVNKLDVSGDGKFTGSLTANSIIKIGGTSSQFLKADGSVDSNSYALASSLSSYVPTSRTLTINGTAYDLSADRSWTISSSQWTTSGSNIYYTTGNVGIGTTSPVRKFEVNGQSFLGGDIFGGLNSGIFFSGNGNYNAGIFASNSGNDLVLQSGTAERMRITSGGNVGIGTASPSYRLDVAGSINVAANAYHYIGGNKAFAGSGSDFLYFFTGTTALAVRNNADTSELLRLTNGGNVGIGTSSPLSYSGLRVLTVNGTSGSMLSNMVNGTAALQISAVDTNSALWEPRNVYLSLATNNTERVRITSGGAVGIGTTNPNTPLHVAGSITVNDVIYLQRASSSLFLPVMNYWNGSGANPLNGTKGDIVAIGNAGGDGVVFANANTERMRLTNTGLGIGTSSPDVFSRGYSGRILGISSSGQSSIGLNGGSGSAAYFDMGVGGTRTFSIYTDASSSDISSIGSLPLTLSTNSTERMRITSGGLVGIGISSPNGGLDINTTATNIFIAGTTTNGYKLTVFKLTDTIAIENVKSGVGYKPIVLAPYGGEVGIGSNGSTYAYIGGSTIYNTSRLSIEVSTDQSGITTNVNSSDTRYHLYFRNTLSTVGSISTNTYATSFNTSSDYRLKEDLKPFNGLSILKDIKVYDFKWKGVEDRNYGVVAHEIAEVIPYAVNGEKDGDMHQSVDYSKLVPILIQSIQELKAELDELKNK